MNRSRNKRASANEAVLHSLLRIMGHLRQVMEPFFSRFGISGPQWGVLRVLHQAEITGEGTLRLSDLSNRLLIQPPSVTGVVDRLERMRLVARQNSTSDRRVRQLGLTAAGRTIISKVLEEHTGQLEALFAGISAREVETLSVSLSRLQEHWKELAQSQPAAIAQASAESD